MLSPVWEWAGRLRESTTNIGIKPYQIRLQLQELCQEVIYWNSEPIDLTFLEQACRIHHRLVFIHPFKDGNGRFTRLISDRYLRSHRCIYPLWPDNLHVEGNDARRRYIQALKEADKGDYDPLLQFMYDLGARDPSIGELLGKHFYRLRLKEERLFKIGKSLLRRGANPNDRSYNGQHPLQLAIKTGQDKLVKLLIDYGANQTCDVGTKTQINGCFTSNNRVVQRYLSD